MTFSSLVYNRGIYRFKVLLLYGHADLPLAIMYPLANCQPADCISYDEVYILPKSREGLYILHIVMFLHLH